MNAVSEGFCTLDPIEYKGGINVYGNWVHSVFRSTDPLGLHAYRFADRSYDDKDYTGSSSSLNYWKVTPEL